MAQGFRAPSRCRCRLGRSGAGSRVAVGHGVATRSALDVVPGRPSLGLEGARKLVSSFAQLVAASPACHTFAGVVIVILSAHGHTERGNEGHGCA